MIAIEELTSVEVSTVRQTLAGAIERRGEAEVDVARAEASQTRARSLVDEIGGQLATAARESATAADLNAQEVAAAIREGRPAVIPESDVSVQLMQIEAERRHAIAKQAADGITNELELARQALAAAQLGVERAVEQVICFERDELLRKFTDCYEAAHGYWTALHGLFRSVRSIQATQPAKALLNHSGSLTWTDDAGGRGPGWQHVQTWTDFHNALQRDPQAPLEI
jgi:hypothetical protein